MQILYIYHWQHDDVLRYYRSSKTTSADALPPQIYLLFTKCLRSFPKHFREVSVVSMDSCRSRLRATYISVSWWLSVVVVKCSTLVVNCPDGKVSCTDGEVSW